MANVTPEELEEELNKRGEVEGIKDASNYLRGTLVKSLQDPLTGALAEDDTQLSKYHGIYQQDDRDLRDERRRQKLEPHYQFLVRIRVPGGVCTPTQWLEVDRIANTYCNPAIRLTTRQAYQLHGIVKRDLKRTIAEINAALLDTIAACGDVNRNVMCNPNPYQSRLHGDVYEYARRLSEHLTPRTTAYHEIWLGEELLSSSRQDEEPIYGKHYLPRKFKIALAIPPSNDVDLFANDLGFIAITEDDHLLGFNVSVGGGLSMTHGETSTYPRLADVIGYCPKHKTLQVAEEIVKIQRDFGDRTNRKHARFKYTIEDRGLDWLKFELNRRLGWAMEPPKPFVFEHSGDRYGWVEGANDAWHHTLFIPNGRILDTEDYPMMTGLREIAKVHDGDFRLTANQNLIIGQVSSKRKPVIDALLEKYRLADTHDQTGLRLNSMACVAFPTCGLAMAESERYFPSLVDKLDVIIRQAGLEHDPILIRMTGCPNGCARSSLAEIGFIGKAPGKYNLYLGAGFYGQRLNKLYRENINEEQILAELTPIIQRYAQEREPGERFGDFVIKAGYVKAVLAGKDFHC
ncbi:assimilatory sulfite reductase (NADPH) hemoprotein subunit [Methylobacter sp.]|uniref:assimilatory sulfite reductase (NADPH) hemoprotein subunit n=1 Tax=Methylobacter sp. TaxID=2051955 RepID=UPI002488AC77|nr:assimilatory sulfite reductase (NADPH) hemoprotein subunit [Methylobacter sp.]MDI1276581.1 assimilatory sulfite reductase (NADPH) hemoprotein subunit [Methylobacter sp.]MDI1357190.1 assimilatory sulfite reductase (NADPH) hemoprotein subunit [Methylobacter sp.]